MQLQKVKWQLILIFFLFWISSECMIPQIIIHSQTEDEAFEYVVNFIRNNAWYKKNYQLRLPPHEVFKKFYVESKELSTSDIIFLKKIFHEEVYPFHPSCETAIIELEKNQSIITSVLEKLKILNKNWNFKIWPAYHILFTLYGPGGSYNSRTGSIIIFHDMAREFLLETTLHEMVHLGIEENIVKKYQLTHWEKERLVDLICKLYLGEFMPAYQMQNIDDFRIDTFVSSCEIINNLPAAIEKFVLNTLR